MWGHVTSSTNGQLYKIKLNKDFLMRLFKRRGEEGKSGQLKFWIIQRHLLSVLQDERVKEELLDCV